MEKKNKKNNQLSNQVKMLKLSLVPPEQESTTHTIVNTGNSALLANSYFAIVAICHQTSPLGERRLEGYINNTKKGGWDYLKEKFLLRALEDEKWASPDHWMTLKPTELSELYEDQIFGKT